jgi:hypothetical protein
MRMPSSGILRRLALVRTDASEEPIPSIIRVTRIGELGTTLSVASNFYQSEMEVILPFETFAFIKPYGVTFQETAFFIVTAVTTSKFSFMILCRKF